MSQGANCYKTFLDGSLHRIRLPITTLHAIPITREQQSGSLKEVYLENGNRLVLCCGFMGRVRLYCHSKYILAKKTFHLAGSGKSILWFVVPRLS